MAYLDNLMSMDSSFMLYNAFPDTWLLQDNFSKETETIAKALQKSFDFQDSDNNNMDFSSELLSPWLNNSDSTTVSGGSVEKENNCIVGSKRLKNNDMVVGSGQGRLIKNESKIKKRRSRACKRGDITFINADVDNFRQLVQEVTGFKFGGCSGGDRGGVVKPEPHRVPNKLQMIGGGGGLHTLDTSAFLVGPSHRSNQLEQVGSGGGVPEEAAVVEEGGGGSASSTTRFDFESYCSFPTLESWKAI